MTTTRQGFVFIVLFLCGLELGLATELSAIIIHPAALVDNSTNTTDDGDMDLRQVSCCCPNPVQISNGAVDFPGPYWNQTQIRYLCNSQHTLDPKDWVQKCEDDRAGGFIWEPPEPPECLPVPIIGGMPFWLEVLVGTVVGMLLLALLVVLFWCLWYLCCRSCCKCCGCCPKESSSVHVYESNTAQHNNTPTITTMDDAGGTGAGSGATGAGTQTAETGTGTGSAAHVERIILRETGVQAGGMEYDYAMYKTNGGVTYSSSRALIPLRDSEDYGGTTTLPGQLHASNTPSSPKPKKKQTDSSVKAEWRPHKKPENTDLHLYQPMQSTK